MSKSLPERPDLEHLKNQAKALLTSLRRAEPDGLARAAELGFTAPYRLAAAQTVVAREYGFPSWAKLKAHVETRVGRFDAFFAAVRAGDRDRVSAILDQDPELVHSRDPKEFEAPALNLAANRNDRKMIDLLLERGADIDARSTWWAGGFGALDTANESTCAYLLAKEATLTPHAAARLGRTDELRAMLAENPEIVRQRGGDGQFPLHFAKTPEIVDLLAEAGAELDARDLDHEGTAMQFRVRDAEVRDRLLERGATPDIFTAVERDDPDMVKRFMEEDPTYADRRPSDPGNPWIPAAPGGHIYGYVIGNRLPHQVAANHAKRRAWEALYTCAGPARRLAMAAWKGDGELARRVRKEHPEAMAMLDPADVRTLAGAAWDRQTSAVALMLELGWPVDAIDSENMTALHRAAFHGFDEIVEMLVRHGPDLSHRNDYGGDPLGSCVYGSLHGWRRDGNHAATAEKLLAAGVARPKQLAGSPPVQEVLRRYGVR